CLFLSSGVCWCDQCFCSLVKSRTKLTSYLLAAGGGLLHAFLECLDVLGAELWPIHLEGQLVQLGGEGEGRLIVFIIHAGEAIGANVEALVPLENHRHSV